MSGVINKGLASTMVIFSVGGASEQLLSLDGPGIEVLAVGTSGRRVSVDDN